MKNTRKILLAISLLAAFALAACDTEEKSEKAPAIGSIRPAGNPKPAELPALAKISLVDAMKDAQAVVTGDVISSELEVEDGNLQYSLDIVGANKKVTEVEIDAGSGKVLGTETGEEKD